MNRMIASALLGRLLLAYAMVATIAALAYALLVPMALGAADEAQRAGAMSYSVAGGAAAFCVLALSALALRPSLVRVVEASAELEIPALPDRLAVYSAPRRASELMAALGIAVLLSGYVPLGGPIDQTRTIATNVGAVCAALATLVLYAATRIALRPLVDTLRSNAQAEDELDEHGRPQADRLASRVAIAVAVPAGAAALMVALLVSAHRETVATAEDEAAHETFNQALGVERRPGESPGSLDVAAEALRGAGVPVSQGVRDYVVAASAPTPASPPFWTIPIALMVVVVAWQIGRRIGLSASSDVESTAQRMAVVGAHDIRSVTMSMARPRSVPEIREMALALDTLAATLLRMSADQKRGLSARTEAARVRSFVLASVSHDLRGPLNSVLGFADLLLSGVEGPLTPGQTESLEALSRGGRDLLRLVDDLLEHAKIDAGRMNLERAWSSVDRIVERARTDAIDRAKSPQSADELVIEGEVGLHVDADGRRMSQALGALIAFAMLRPGSDGRVAIRVRAEGRDHVLITIRGGGSTPTRDALSRMFEPFDFAPTGARAPAGLNLAVAVARGLIGLHGGTVAANPHDEGGIVLAITLPAAKGSPKGRSDVTVYIPPGSFKPF